MLVSQCDCRSNSAADERAELREKFVFILFVSFCILSAFYFAYCAQCVFICICKQTIIKMYLLSFLCRWNSTHSFSVLLRWQREKHIRMQAMELNVNMNTDFFYHQNKWHSRFSLLGRADRRNEGGCYSFVSSLFWEL